jgi:hypothetical protein
MFDCKPNSHNARLTEQIFDGGFCAYFYTKGDSGNLSGGAACYELHCWSTFFAL